MRKILCVGPKHFDQLKSESGPAYNSALRLPRWRWPVMRLWRLNVYGAIIATLLFDATERKSFCCSTMKSYKKLSTTVLSIPVDLCNNIFVQIWIFLSTSLKKTNIGTVWTLRSICAWLWVSLC